MKLFLLFFLFTSLILAQGEEKKSIAEIKNLYENFGYREVITLSGKLLEKRDSLQKNDLLELLMMKAVSHYVVAEEDLVRSSFIEMLKTDRTYMLDSEKVSPKIIKIFTDVRNDFLQSVPENNAQLNDSGSPVVVPDYNQLMLKYSEEKGSMIRSFIFPGWGHLYSGQTVKGTAIASTAFLNIGALGYFIYDTNRKYDDYINERDQSLIKQKYDTYNRTYMTRNILISSLVLVYVFAQFDLLYFGEKLPQISVQLPGDTGSFLAARLNLRLPF